MEWANENNKRWAFTLSNAGSNYFEDRCDLIHLSEINWDAVRNNNWRDDNIKDGKQAEFLIEQSFPWHLIERIGVNSQEMTQQVVDITSANCHSLKVEKIPQWYY